MSDTQKRKVGLALTSLLFGLLFWFPLLGLFCSIVALVCGIIALVRVKSDNTRYGGAGMAISGIVLGVLGVLLVPVVSLLAAIAIPNLLRANSRPNLSNGKQY